MTTSKTTTYITKHEDGWVHLLVIYDPDIDSIFHNVTVNGENRG